jgi:hypothetical protein
MEQDDPKGFLQFLTDNACAVAKKMEQLEETEPGEFACLKNCGFFCRAVELTLSKDPELYLMFPSYYKNEEQLCIHIQLENMTRFLTLVLRHGFLLSIFMDRCRKGKQVGDDHWFNVVGLQNNQVVLAEFNDSQDKDNVFMWQFMSLIGFISWLKSVIIGEVEDRFYGKKGTHTVKIVAFDRKPMTIKQIRDFLIALP